MIVCLSHLGSLGLGPLYSHEQGDNKPDIAPATTHGRTHDRPAPAFHNLQPPASSSCACAITVSKTADDKVPHNPGIANAATTFGRDDRRSGWPRVGRPTTDLLNKVKREA